MMQVFPVLDAVASAGVVLGAFVTVLNASLTVLCASVTVLSALQAFLEVQVFPALEVVASAGVVRKVVAALYFESLWSRPD